MKKLMLIALICAATRMSASSYPVTPQSPVYSPKLVSEKQVKATFIDLFFRALESTPQEFPRNFLALKCCASSSPYRIDIDSMILRENDNLSDCSLGQYLNEYVPQSHESFKQTNALIIAAYFSNQRSRVTHDEHTLLRNLLDSAIAGRTSCEEVQRFARCGSYDLTKIGLNSDEDTDTLFDWLSTGNEPIAKLLIECFAPEVQMLQTPTRGSRVHNEFLNNLNKTLAHPEFFDEFVNQHADQMKHADEIECFPDQMVAPLLHRSTVKKKGIVARLITLTGKQKKRSLKPVDAFCKMIQEAVYAPKKAFIGKLATLKALCEKEEYDVDRILYDLAAEETSSTDTLFFRSVGGWLNSLLKQTDFDHKAQLCAVLSVVYPYRMYKGDAPHYFLEAIMRNYIDDASSTLDEVSTCYSGGTYNIDALSKWSNGSAIDESLAEMLQDELLNEDVESAFRALDVLRLAQDQRTHKHAVLLVLVEQICEGIDLYDLLDQWLKWFPCSPQTIRVEHGDSEMTLQEFLVQENEDDLLEFFSKDRDPGSAVSSNSTVESVTPIRRTARSQASSTPRRRLFGSHYKPSPLVKTQTPYRSRLLPAHGSSSSDSSASVSPASPNYPRGVRAIKEGAKLSLLASNPSKGSTGAKSSSDDSHEDLKKPQKGFFTPRTILGIGAGMVVTYYAYRRFSSSSRDVQAQQRGHTSVSA